MKAQAAYGEGGYNSGETSRYLGLIDWVDWSKCDGPDNCRKLSKSYTSQTGELNWDREDAGTLFSKDLRDGGSYRVRSETQLGENAKVTTFCSISEFRQNAYGSYPIDGKAPLYIHIPGSYKKDGWDNVYQRFDKGTRTGIAAGIGRANGGRARFDVSCEAFLVTDNENNERREIPIQGLVFADAEVTSGNETSYIIPAKIDRSRSVEWRQLDYNRVPGDNTKIKLEYGPNNGSDRPDNSLFYAFNPQKHQYLWEYSSLANLLDRNNAIKFIGQSETDQVFQPVSVLYASNANGAYVDMEVKGGNYFAIGVVLGGDSSDGPASYGKAGAIVQPQISGQKITHTIENLKDAPKAVVSAGAPPFLGVNGPDLEAQFFSKNYWNTLLNDDLYNSTSNGDAYSRAVFDDEDAITKPLLVTAQPGTFKKTIKCKPAPGEKQTNVSGWLDWNADGHFTNSERSVTVCGNNNQATLSWNVTPEMLPGAGKTIEKSMLRLMATTEPTAKYSFNSLLPDGEVEDHAVTLVRPTLTVTKQILSSNGQPKNDADRAGFGFTANVPNTTFPQVPLTPQKLIDIVAQQTTSGTQSAAAKAGTASWPLAFNNLKPELTDAGQTAPIVNATVSETPKTGYQMVPNTRCEVAEKNQKFTTVKAYNVAASMNQRKPVYMDQADTYAWPEEISPNVTSSKKNAFSVELSPVSVMNCTVSNQPYGQISVKPTVDTSEVNPPMQIDSELQFAGTYSCTAPTVGPFKGAAKVDGTWGPVKADNVWTSDPKKDLIPAGASCTITQTAITSTSQGGANPAKPVAGSAAYSWKNPVEYQTTNTITAAAGLIGEQVNMVTAVNKVELAPNTTLRWTKVDEKHKLLTGAVFSLKTTDAKNTEQTVADITDCVADSAGKCEGSDKDPEAGKYKVENVPAGKWELTETAAPAGFAKLTQPVKGTVEPADLTSGKDVGEVVNTRITAEFLPTLPITGGLSTTIFLLIGASAIVAAAVTGVISVKRRERGGATH
ncbi:CshA/CshB family fibrillar adhesin-related protein [Arcanobacterium hippocoleae]|uniref:LPXTG-motif cell wall-anchored protein n=1 Tax=Arcanobacterium hippocoleae TaxID=149017 RepID=A0ABU1T378_9ACTO|nr:CshA/CshB family fibrillar adhesin-related protein [Arcanobacterium hippocoleae]MDR6939695.1 LPXTG-motif cell wall-anchored protein [Arcanobacterium hippocoleae]